MAIVRRLIKRKSSPVKPPVVKPVAILYQKFKLHFSFKSPSDEVLKKMVRNDPNLTYENIAMRMSNFTIRVEKNMSTYRLIESIFKAMNFKLKEIFGDSLKLMDVSQTLHPVRTDKGIKWTNCFCFSDKNKFEIMSISLYDFEADKNCVSSKQFYDRLGKFGIDFSGFNETMLELTYNEKFIVPNV